MGRRLARALEWLPERARALDAGAPDAAATANRESLRLAVVAKNRLWFDSWRPMNWAFLGGDRTEQPSSRDHVDPKIRWFPAEMERFGPLVYDAELKVESRVEAFLNTIEYQIPLTAKENLFFVTFVDHGTVERTASIKDYRVSAGFGFRIQIPALGPVPVAFDFAFPLNKRDSDNQQIFAFYIGLFGGQ